LLRIRRMAVFALIHGGGDVGWYWHLVERELRARGHQTCAPDLPIDDDDATLGDHAEVVLDAIAALPGTDELIVVGQSFGGYVAPIVADSAGANRLILVAGMIPQPGESADEMWEATGWRMPRGSGILELFYADVDPGLAAEAMSKGRPPSDSTGAEPWPLAAWPDVPTHFILCRNDRFFPVEWLRPVVRARLGIEPDEIDSGHTPALSHPTELVELMESYRTLGTDRAMIARATF
jgi:pimeloyl-ACP methyl ester carboxylesterase